MRRLDLRSGISSAAYQQQQGRGQEPDELFVAFHRLVLLNITLLQAVQIGSQRIQFAAIGRGRVVLATGDGSDLAQSFLIERRYHGLAGADLF